MSFRLNTDLADRHISTKHGSTDKWDFRTLEYFRQSPMTESLEELSMECLRLPSSELAHLHALRRLRTLHLDRCFHPRLSDATIDGLSPPSAATRAHRIILWRVGGAPGGSHHAKGCFVRMDGVHGSASADAVTEHRAPPPRIMAAHTSTALPCTPIPHGFSSPLHPSCPRCCPIVPADLASVDAPPCLISALANPHPTSCRILRAFI